MATTFEIIVEEFTHDLGAIETIVITFSSDSPQNGKARIAAANSATLLLAATFEDFVREMAREYARIVVNKAESVDKLPSKLASTVWKRTMDALAKVRFDIDREGIGTENWFAGALARFTVVYEFCKGDLSQDIYQDLIHNESNMRPNELNSMFKVSGLNDVCSKLSSRQPVLDYFGETESGKAHGKLLAALEEFFERRNGIAHALGRGQSSGPNQILNDIALLRGFGRALCETLAA